MICRKGLLQLQVASFGAPNVGRWVSGTRRERDSGVFYEGVLISP